MSDIRTGSWIVAKEWDYPARVTCLNEHFVLFIVMDLQGSFECHAPIDQVRLAKKSDFDAQILALSKDMVKAEELISKLYEAQEEVSC